MTNEPQNNEVQQQDAPVADTTEYLEFVGWPPYGTEFTREHQVPAKHMKDVHDVKTKKDHVWRKGPNGRMLLPVSDFDQEVLSYLESDPAFKRVTL